MGCAQRPRVNTSSREGPNLPQPLHAGHTTTTPQSLQHTYTQKANITSSFEKDMSLRLYVYNGPWLAYESLRPLSGSKLSHLPPQNVWVPGMAVFIQSSVHVARTKQWSQRMLSGKMWFGLDLPKELFGLAQSSPSYWTFFHLALVFAGQNPRGRYYYSRVKQGHLIRGTDSDAELQKGTSFSGCRDQC